MKTPSKFKPFYHRPHIRGGLFEKYSSTNILHCDAYVYEHASNEYLLIDWLLGGKKRIGVQCWYISPDGLTPVQGMANISHIMSMGHRVYWRAHNWQRMAAIHQRVLQLASVTLGPWSRVSVLAHYVLVRDRDCDFAPAVNGYKQPKSKAQRALDGLSIEALQANVKTLGPGRGRGRPPRGAKALKLTVCPLTGRLPDVL